MFEVELRSGELHKNGNNVKTQELPFRALTLLLNHPNEVLSRERFRQALWPDGVFVDFDHGISSTINRLRDALGDSADNPVFIETVERRGYRWIAPTHIPAPPALPRPVLIKQEKSGVQESVSEKPVAAPPLPAQRWAMLLLPPLVLLLGMWSVWPKFRAARATTSAPHANSSRPSDSAQRTANSEAEQFYLKGRFYWQKRTPDGLSQALDSFTQAIVRDPDYAPAYVGLADTYNLMREYTLMPANEAYPRALAAAQKAVELDDQSSDAHASLAFALFYGMWDAANAEHEFHRAIELNPRNAVAHHWYATCLATLGRNAESLLEIERAQALDPASKAILADKGDLLAAAGRRDESLTLLKQLETSEPDFVSPHRYLKDIYFEASDDANYLREWKKEATLMQDKSALKLVETAERGYAAGGSKGMLQSMRALQKTLYERGLVSPYRLAQTDSLLGNKQEALGYLKLAYDKHDESTVQLETDRTLKSLHDEPEYKELVARLNFRARN
jgi:DNA-binding winged helix-turn-helix (wHTH) protein/Tfp pilus assembly protein PilF